MSVSLPPAPSPIRTRFAPSPTGYLHVGSARTALFNWLFTRSVGGTFILRIEDTDLARNQPEVVDNLLEVMTWLGLDWDEGPHRQSDRADRHRGAVEQLLSSGHAYVDDGAVRFRIPEEGVTAWEDAVVGRVEFENSVLEDFVIRRRDGSPLFLLANVVDDLDMGVTHVIRGEDMVNNVPKQLLLLRALGVEREFTYAHLPLLVDDRRRKLSKRFGDVAIESYRSKGFLAPALLNYIALLGWGPADGVEIRPIAEIVEQFRLQDVNRSSAFFDVKKLTSFNAEYIRSLEPGAFVQLARAHYLGQTEGYVRHLQHRSQVLGDVPGLIDWLYNDPAEVVTAWQKVMASPDAAALLDRSMEAFAECPWEAAELHARLAEVGEGMSLKLGKAQGPIRVAVMGQSAGPPLFESLELLGRERTLARLRAARARL